MKAQFFKFSRRIFLAVATALFSTSVFATSVPALTGRVVDNANIISSRDKKEITAYLAALEQTTGVQAAVLTIKTLNGESLEDYSMKVCETWKLGQKGKDNGVLLLVSLEERKIRIEVGYGLEGDLTDTKCGLIIRKVIIPQFRNGDYSEGILRGVKNISGIVAGNEDLVSSKVLDPEKESSAEGSALFGLLFVFGWFLLFSSLASGRANHFLPWIIFTSAFRNSYNSTHSSGNHHSGHSSFGGGSFGGGGGFHGGGGGFGGGGASGGW